jgi:hypothetical protein
MHTFHAERFKFCSPIAKSLRAQRLNPGSAVGIQIRFKEKRYLGGGYVDTFDLFYILIHSVNDAQLEEYSLSASCWS